MRSLTCRSGSTHTTPGHYEAGHDFERDAFRYLTVVHNTTETIDVSNVTVYWTTSPEMEDPSACTGYFNSDSEKLNRIWYAETYTNQVYSADPTTGVALGAPVAGWYYNYTISNSTSVLMDGGKGDLVVWPGDIVILRLSILVSTNSLDPVWNALDSLFLYQESNSCLPVAGYPLAQLFAWGFTYHCHTLNDAFDYFMFTGNMTYLASIWDQQTLGVDYILPFIDSSCLANMTSTSDWGRDGMSGHNIEANSILRYTLRNAEKLATIMNDTSETGNCEALALGISMAANRTIRDDSVSLYCDNGTRAAGSSAPSHPRDGNVWAVMTGIANGTRAAAVSDALKARRVRPYGAPAVEAGQTISPFATGFELQAHYLAGHADFAVDLMELMWAD